MSPELLGLSIVPIMYLLLIPSALLTRKVRRSRKLRAVVVAKYEPPADLSPAEIGYLYDDKFGSNELLATIISMYRQDKLLLVKGSNTHVTILKRQPKNLTDLEFAVYNFVSSQPNSTYYLSLIDSFTDQYAGMQKNLADSVTMSLNEKGFLNRTGWINTNESQHRLFVWLSLFQSLVIVGLLTQKYILEALYSNPSDTYNGVNADLNGLVLIIIVLVTWPVMYALYLGAYAIFLYYAGLPKGSTPELRSIWPDIDGFREFIKIVEYQRLKADNNLLDESYPWCLAFGLDPGVDKAFSQKK